MNLKNSISFFKDMKRRSTISSNKFSGSSKERNSSKIRNSEFDLGILKSRHTSKEIDYENLPSDQKHEILEACLKYDPDSRSQTTIKKIMNLTKEIKFFKEISEKHGEKVFYQCCKYMRKENYEQDQVLFNQGDVANHFYIILKGRVVLKIRVFDERTHEFTESLIGELETGAAFGELALLENKSRAATVICKTMCHFASLNKQDYQAILGEFQKKELEEKANFIASLSVFSHLNKKTIFHLSYYFGLRKVKRNQYLYQENDLSNEIFFIKDGEFKVEFI